MKNLARCSSGKQMINDIYFFVDISNVGGLT